MNLQSSRLMQQLGSFDACISSLETLVLNKNSSSDLTDTMTHSSQSTILVNNTQWSAEKKHDTCGNQEEQHHQLQLVFPSNNKSDLELHLCVFLLLFESRPRRSERDCFHKQEPIKLCPVIAEVQYIGVSCSGHLRIHFPSTVFLPPGIQLWISHQVLCCCFIFGQKSCAGSEISQLGQKYRLPLSTGVKALSGLKGK